MWNCWLHVWHVSPCLTWNPRCLSSPGRRRSAGSEPSTSRSCSWSDCLSRMFLWGNSCSGQWWRMTWGWWCCCWHTAPRRRSMRLTVMEMDALRCTSRVPWPMLSSRSCSSGWVGSTELGEEWGEGRPALVGIGLTLWFTSEDVIVLYFFKVTSLN